MLRSRLSSTVLKQNRRGRSWWGGGRVCVGRKVDPSGAGGGVQIRVNLAVNLKFPGSRAWEFTVQERSILINYLTYR